MGEGEDEKWLEKREKEDRKSKRAGAWRWWRPSPDGAAVDLSLRGRGGIFRGIVVVGVIGGGQSEMGRWEGGKMGRESVRLTPARLRFWEMDPRDKPEDDSVY